MNPLPPNADELVSAYLDGQAAPDEIVAVESSTELMARVETMRALTSQLSAPVTPPADLKEAHLAAALGAFDAMFEESAEPTSAPGLAAVPDPAPTPEPAREPRADSTDSAVRSLDAARERSEQRREQRRFSPGVIAAAIAAVMMLAIVGALSFGGGSADDVATSSAADTADLATEAADDGAAQFSAEADQQAGGLSEVETERVSPTSVAAAQVPSAAVGDAMADEEEAMEDEEAMADEDDAMDEEEAMDEAAAAESAGDDSAAADSDSGFDLMFGSFPSTEALLDELENTSVDEWINRRDAFGQGLFPGCAAEIPELAADVNSLAGAAFLDDVFVEIHMQLNDAGATDLYLVSVEECTILGTNTTS